MINIWVILSLGMSFSTLLLQVLNYKLYHSDNRNSTRVTLLAKQLFFIGHGVMMHYVTETIRTYHPWWFGQAFGMFFFFGVSCWFFVFFRGAFNQQQS